MVLPEQRVSRHDVHCQIDKKTKQKKINRDPYIPFVELAKAFDTVSCPGLWNIFPRIGTPPKMVKMIRCFHDGMNARYVNSSEG